MRRNKIYWEDIKRVASYNLPWDKLNNSKVLITGITGMIGTVITDVLMCRNIFFNDNIFVIGIGRNYEKCKERFSDYLENENFNFFTKDINEALVDLPYSDFIIHCASNTHPLKYATEPINTINTCVLGTNNVLNYAVASNVKRVVFLSSVEIYGENRGDIKEFDENYSGYINCNTLRAGYPEGKRVGESLCKAYEKEYCLDIVIPRLCRIYGSTMADDDSKAIAQFIKKAVSDEDIVLKSDGNQLFSYMYVMDAVLAIFTVLFKGENGEAYNVSDEKSDILLKDLAELIADKSGKRVIFDLPGDNEKKGFSVVTKAIMNSEKLRKIGFNAFYGIDEGISRTIDILK